MTYGFDEHDTAIAADDDHLPNGGNLPSGGHLVAGSFNSALDRPNTVLTYVSRINPNLAVGGIALCVLGGVVALVVTAVSASSAQRFEAEQKAAVELAKAEAVSTEAQTKLMDKYASISAQRPICISFNCGGWGRQQPDDQEQFIEEQPIEEEPIEHVQPAAQTTPAQAVPTDAKTVEFWQYHQNNQPFIDQWYAFCQPNWLVSPECTAMFQAFTRQPIRSKTNVISD